MRTNLQKLAEELRRRGMELREDKGWRMRYRVVRHLRQGDGREFNEECCYHSASEIRAFLLRLDAAERRLERRSDRKATTDRPTEAGGRNDDVSRQEPERAGG